MKSNLDLLSFPQKQLRILLFKNYFFNRKQNIKIHYDDKSYFGKQITKNDYIVECILLSVSQNESQLKNIYLLSNEIDEFCIECDTNKYIWYSSLITEDNKDKILIDTRSFLY